MSEMYNSWFKSEIEQRLSEIKDFSNRINFLFDEKSRFISNNRGVEADQVIQKFNTLIEKEKSLFELNKAQNNNTESEPEIFLDYSNNSKAERIVFLKELGILDFLRDKMNEDIHCLASNKLAEIVSTFTDIPQSTAQSYLNPIYSQKVDQSKNPITEKSLMKVKQKLKNIGFKS